MKTNSVQFKSLVSYLKEKGVKTQPQIADHLQSHNIEDSYEDYQHLSVRLYNHVAGVVCNK